MTDKLTEYIISYFKEDLNFPLTSQGSQAFRDEIEKTRSVAIANTDYADRVRQVSSLCVLSFVTRPDTKTLSIHRVWSDKTKADQFFETNDNTVFENFRKLGWNVCYMSRPFDTTVLNAHDIEII